MWVVGGMPVHGICGSRLVYREVVETIRYPTFGDVGIQLVVIRLWETGLKKIKIADLPDLYEGTLEKGQCDLVCGAPLDDWANGGYVYELFTCGEHTFTFFRNWSIHSKFPALFFSIIQQEMFKKIIWIKITTFFKWHISIILLVLFIQLVQTLWYLYKS